MTSPDAPSFDQIGRFLADYHGQPIEQLAPLDGGFWSTAYRYDVGDEALVFRLAASGEGFEMDRAAWRFKADGLPVPEVVDVGEALGRWFAISRRAHGQFLEDVRPDEANKSGPMVDQLLDALQASSAPPGTPSDWFSESPGSWRDWLERGLIDDPQSTVGGWRPKIAADPELDRLFRRTEARVLELIEHCPERRDLVHGDLLHQNVLVGEGASAVNAVFSWKCSVLGDHLYDVAWLTLWGPWHPGLQRLDAWSRLFGRNIDGDDLQNAEVRHHCYELHIGVQHLAWCSWTGNAASLAGVALRTAHVLERGPRPLPQPL